MSATATRTGLCRVCGAPIDRRRRNAAGKVVRSSLDTQTCPQHRWLRANSDVLVDKDTPYRRDVAAQLFVAIFKGGATLDSIAEALGVSRERVRQIEGDAIAKLRERGLKIFDVDLTDPEERWGTQADVDDDYNEEDEDA